MKTGIIYKATNRSNGKSYIGQTTRSLSLRKKEHFRVSRDPNQEQYSHLFHRAIRKYGIDGFEWRILEKCDTSLLNDKEIFHIVFHNTYAPNGQHGYNMTRGGDNHFGSSGKYHYLNRMSRDEKQKWLKQNRLGKNNPNYGNSFATSGNNHFSKRMTSEEYRKWVSGISGKNNYQTNLTPRERKDKCWINKLSTSERLKWAKHISGGNNPYSKYLKENPGAYKGKNNPLFGIPNTSAQKEYVITFPDGQEYRIKGLRTFCNFVGLNSGNMSCCARGIYKQIKGYQCRPFNSQLDKHVKWWYPCK